MMGPKFRTWVGSVTPLLWDLVLAQVCRDRATNPSVRGPVVPPLGRGLHPSEERPPASGWGLRVGVAGVIRVPGFPPIATTSQTSDLRNVT